MNSYDLVNEFEEKYDRLKQVWQAALGGFQNARSALTDALSWYANRDPRFQSAHSQIVQLKQALAALHGIDDLLVALLDRLDDDIGR